MAEAVGSADRVTAQRKSPRIVLIARRLNFLVPKKGYSPSCAGFSHYYWVNHASPMAYG